jgi:hypothetical protein
LTVSLRKLDPKLSEEDIDNLVSASARSVYSVEIDEKGTKSDQLAKVTDVELII